MVDTLLFDLDNTLLDFNQAEKIAVSKTLKHFHIVPEDAILKRYSELNLAQWKLLEQFSTILKGREDICNIGIVQKDGVMLINSGYQATNRHTAQS